MNGIFGNLFDFNCDGELDTIEKALELNFLEELMKKEMKDNFNTDDMNDDFW